MLRKFLILIFMTLFFMESPICLAGALDLEPDAPVILQTASWLLGFLSKSIQSQALAYSLWIVTVMVGVQGIARGIAEILGLFAAKTKTTTDDKALLFFCKVAEFCGKVIGWFGVGYPKSLK